MIPSKVTTLVKIADILSPPVICAVSADPSIEKFAEMAKSSPQLLPVIKLGITKDGKLYAINHHDVILGCKRAGSNAITEISATIADDFAGSTDILMAHVREIITNEQFNPVSLYGVINYLEQRKSLDKKQILKLLWLHDTPYEKLILSNSNNFISSQSIDALQNMIDRLSEKTNIVASQLTIPLYMLSKISKIQEQKEQLQLISEIHINMTNMTGSKFAWITPEQIDYMIRYNRQDATHEENNREKSVVAIPTEIKNVTESRVVEKQEQAESQDIDEETELIRKTIPNMIIIPDEKTGKPSLLVNKKTGSIAKIDAKSDDTQDIIKTSKIDSKSLFAIPLDVSLYLQLDDKDAFATTKHRNFDDIVKLEKFLKKFSNQAKNSPVRMSLFWNAA